MTTDDLPSAQTVGAISLIAIVAFVLPLTLLLVTDRTPPLKGQRL